MGCGSPQSYKDPDNPEYLNRYPQGDLDRISLYTDQALILRDEIPIEMKKNSAIRLLHWVLAVSLCAGGCTAGAPSASLASDTAAATRTVDPFASFLGQVPIDPRRIASFDERGDVDAAVRAFYERRDYAPAWTSESSLSPQAYRFVEQLLRADDEGLEPADYRAAELAREIHSTYANGTPPSPARYALELALTETFIVYATDLLRGRVKPAAIGVTWHTSARRADVASVLEAGIDQGDVAAALQGLDPPHPEYRRLARELAQYRQIAATGGWPRVPDGPTIHPGDAIAASRLYSLEERLSTEGYPPPREDGAADARQRRVSTSVAPARYGGRIADALRVFQQHHGITPDGILGRATMQELNIPATVRVRQIALNMERWRWLPTDLGNPHIRVNVAGFDLGVYEDDRQVMQMAVIVGKEGWGTPFFSDKLQYIILNPYWNVPPSIAVDDILPKVKSDPSYLSRNEFELAGGGAPHEDAVDWSQISATNLPFRFRQRPGPANPLGRIKFMFPNQFNVYLHDTPSKALFRRTDRAFSHGCIRIEKPFELATYLLRSRPEWSSDHIRAAIDSLRNQRVNLPAPVPVYILYWTASVDDLDQINFYQDIYGVDAKLEGALRRRGPEGLMVDGERAARAGGSTATAPL